MSECVSKTSGYDLFALFGLWSRPKPWEQFWTGLAKFIGLENFKQKNKGRESENRNILRCILLFREKNFANGK